MEAHPAAQHVDMALLRREEQRSPPASDAKPDRRRRGIGKGFGLFNVHFLERR